jgi:hypothetical protein
MSRDVLFLHHFGLHQIYTKTHPTCMRSTCMGRTSMWCKKIITHTGNVNDHLFIFPKLIWLLKLPLYLGCITIVFWSNDDFKETWYVYNFCTTLTTFFKINHYICRIHIYEIKSNGLKKKVVRVVSRVVQQSFLDFKSYVNLERIEIWFLTLFTHIHIYKE